MKARCTQCNAALKYYNKRGFSLAAQRCHCGGTYQRMKQVVLNGEAPLQQYTQTLMGKKYHSLYNNGNEKFLYDRANDVFINVTELLNQNPATV